MKKLTMKYQSVQAMRDAGWTEEELLELQKPERRTKKAEWDAEHTFFRWPKIDDVSIVGLFSLLTREEKDAYNAYHKKHPATGASTGSSKVSEETLKQWQRLEEFCKDIPEALALIEQMKPRQHIPLLEAMFGPLSEAVKNGTQKVTLQYVMYRGKDNCFCSKPQPTLQEVILEFGEDMTPAFSKQSVLDNVAKLKKQGIDIEAAILTQPEVVMHKKAQAA